MTDAPERIWALSDRRKTWQDHPPDDGQREWQWEAYIRSDLVSDITAERDALRDNYTYIGKDGKPVLARELEDERDQLKAELAEARVALAAIDDMGKDLRGAKMATLKIGLSLLCEVASDALNHKANTTPEGEQ